MTERAYLGVDVGTGSVRAALFDAGGRRLGMGVHPIQIFHPSEDFVEQSSEDIWRAAGKAIRAALAEAGLRPERVAGIGFDATCSLVALDANDQPVSVSPTGRDEQNVVVWMDHRATEQAERINKSAHAVLRYVGGTISPEMQTPKLLWLAERLPQAWRRSQRFFDLADFMSYRATGNDTRSLCTAVCKWTYLGHEQRFSDDFFEQIGLGELVSEGYRRIGTRIRPMGEPAGGVSAQAASELGLVPGIPVGIGIIDAHAGGIGMLGAELGDVANFRASLEARLALIGGTSSCHMAVAREPHFVPGIWGPYFSAMIPGLWLTEGGQSATGALIDHVIRSHCRGAELEQEARAQGTTPQALLNGRLDALAAGVRFEAELTRDLHVLPYFHGNRSPRADPTLRGIVSGLKLSDSVDSLALVYLATLQAIAHGTRHIIDTMNAHGYRIDTILACGGDTKNPKFVQAHADITGCRVLLPREPEAVLLGSAILGAVASGDFATSEPEGSEFLRAMNAMSAAGTQIQPSGAEIRAFYAKKQAVFERMYDDFTAWRRLMS
jgi:FGGY-family pentulose kinase